MKDEKHLSSQFDAEMNAVSSLVMEMGGLVEQQIRNAAEAMIENDADLAKHVLRNEERVNAFEMQVDHELVSIISRRQPTARDLRLLIAIARTISNLERAGDEAAKMARTVTTLLSNGHARILPSSELRLAAGMASDLLRKALDAFARLDVPLALENLRADDLIDIEYEGFTRKLITYMMEDPRTISSSLELMFLAKSVERIGDHAKNISESVIYVVNGLDVRHKSLETIESQLQ